MSDIRKELTETQNAVDLLADRIADLQIKLAVVVAFLEQLGVSRDDVYREFENAKQHAETHQQSTPERLQTAAILKLIEGDVGKKKH
jgi:hypothetical protein